MGPPTSPDPRGSDRDGAASGVRVLIDGPRPLVALHGFTLHGGQFATLAGLLRRPCIAPDLPGHGDSPAVPTRFGDAVDAVARVLVTRRPPLPLLGYSQGGRVALAVTLEHPELVSHLILISATTGIADPIEREARRRADEALAGRIETEPLERFVDSWLDLPAVAVTGVDRAARAADRAVRLENRSAGLAAALRAFGQGSQPPLTDRLGEIRVPLLTMAGANDHRYVEIGASIAAAVAHGTAVVVPDRGHNLVLEDPEAVAAAVTAFLDGV